MLHALRDTSYIRRLYLAVMHKHDIIHKSGSTYNVLHCRHRMTEALATAAWTCTENVDMVVDKITVEYTDFTQAIYTKYTCTYTNRPIRRLLAVLYWKKSHCLIDSSKISSVFQRQTSVLIPWQICVILSYKIIPGTFRMEQCKVCHIDIRIVSSLCRL